MSSGRCRHRRESARSCRPSGASLFSRESPSRSPSTWGDREASREASRTMAATALCDGPQALTLDQLPRLKRYVERVREAYEDVTAH